MATDEPDFQFQITALRAQLAALQGRTQEAIETLGNQDDPESVLSRLTILTDAKRYAEAADVVRGKAAHERWCEQAVLAFAAAGEITEAKRLTDWAHRQKEQPLLWPACLVARAKGRHIHSVGNRPPKPVLPGELDPKDASVLRDALNDLEPVVATVRAQRRVLTGVEVSAVALAMEFTNFLGDRDEYARLADLLWVRTPIPLHYVFAVIRKAIPANPELPARLRAERGDTFEGNRLAAYVEGMILGQPKEALAATRELLQRYRSADQVEQLVHLLVLLASKFPEGEGEQVREEAEALLGPGSRYARFRAIERLLKADQYGEAEAQLGQAQDEDDPNWLELMAGVRVGQKREGDALDLLLGAVEKYPEPMLLRKTAFLADKTGKASVATTLLERILRAEPDDVLARARLAQLCIQGGRYDVAAGHYRELRKLEPHVPTHGINEAIALSLDLRHDASLRVYDEVCSTGSPPLAAVVGRAMLLKALNRTEDAFKSLEPFRENFWDDADFLKAYVDLGYAAKREQEAQHGFLRLHELQTKGAIPKVLHAVDLKELLEMFRQHAENEETVERGVLEGKLPWILAGAMLNRTPAESLHERTAALRWQRDDPPGWSKHTVYATHGYVVLGDVPGEKWLEKLQASERGKPAVLDLTALMTLHRLGLMGKVADYFGTCLYPIEYHAAALQEQPKLVAHQPSRLEAARNIKALIDGERINEEIADQPLPYVHEYLPEGSKEEGDTFALIDLLPALKSGEYLSDTELANFESLAGHSSRATESRPVPHSQQAISVHHSTLEALDQKALLKPVLAGFQVHIRDADRRAIEGQIASWQERQTLWDRQASLWAAVKADKRFVPSAHGIPQEFRVAEKKEENERDAEHTWLPLYGAFLANEKSLPLLVDDRTCQQFVLSDRKSATVAFGVDACLEGLLDAKLLEPDEAAEAYLRLMSWRYKFVLPPVPVLVALAKRSLKTPPGQSLRAVSRYIQDTMRDPGLFAGLEPTEPPMAMAHKVFLGWSSILTQFVITLWTEESVPEDAAEAFTRWTFTEALPSVPQNLGPNGRVLADGHVRVVMGHALARAASLEPSAHVNKALLAIADNLGVTEAAFLEHVAEVANAL